MADIAAAFERVRATGMPEVVLVSGEAGVGKSALVDQWAKAWLPKEIHLATGKSEKLQSDVPYAPFAKALRAAMLRILGESAPVLNAVRARLAGSLAGSSRLLIDLVPETEFVLGASPPLPDVPSNFAQARTARALLLACAALGTQGRPFVLFLDDLQWLDEGSLHVVRAFLEAPPPNVLLIGSYRAEEMALSDLGALAPAGRASAAPVTRIEVRPLTPPDTAELIANALNSAPEDIAGLAEQVHARTGGNAFYVHQLLQQFVDEKAVAFDLRSGRWTWTLPAAEGHANVADFMVERLRALETGELHLLRRLAFLGGRCPPALVPFLLGEDPAAVERAVVPLAEAGLVWRSEGAFQGAHDKVLEAAYALTPPEARAGEHRVIAGQMIVAYGDDAPEAAFDIAMHIERCTPEALSQSERLSFVRVLRHAARRARHGGAAAQALSYIRLARDLIDPAWRADQEALVFEVEWLHCDGLLAQAQTEDALRDIDQLLATAARPIDQADVFRLKAIGHTLQSDYERAIEAALSGLALLGFPLERNPAPEALDAAYRACRAKLDAHGVAHVARLPEACDPAVRSALALLSTMISTFFVESPLRLLHVIKIVDLTLAHGTTPESAYGLAWFGVLSAHEYGAYLEGAAYGLQARELAQRDGYEAQRTAALLALDQVAAWTRPLHFALALAREAATIGRAAGDLGMACYARNHIASDLLALGAPLDTTRADIEEGLSWTREVGYRDIEHILAAQHTLADTLITGRYDPERVVARADIGSIPTLFWTRNYAGITAFMFEDMEAALLHLEEAMRLRWAAPAHIDTALCAWFYALSRAGCAQAGTAPREALDTLREIRARFAQWAEMTPATFGSKHLLLEGEAARLSGDATKALALYEQAAQAAGAAGFGHEQALAYELAARCCRGAGLDRAAGSYVEAAMEGYRRWGAAGKVLQVRRAFPLPTEDGATHAPQTQGELDLSVITRSAQTLAEEIGLEQVVRTLMRDMIRHAGARSGLLLLMRGGEPVIEASADSTPDTVKVELRSALPTARDLPMSVLNTVLRTGKTFVLGDASRSASAAEDCTARAARSVLCLPLMKRGTLVGILHLENDQASDVFTPERIAMLEILAPQAAISLDSARLYQDLAEENARRLDAEFALREARAELARSTRASAIESYAASIAHEINQPLAGIVANADAALRWVGRAQPDVRETTQALERIRAGARRAADIVASLRALAHQAPMQLAPAHLDEIVDDVLRLTREDLDTHAIRIETRLARGDGAVLVDRVQMQQVVFNIITNALHAMSSIEPARRCLTVASDYDSGRVRLSITDTGIGMEETLLARIFQPFFTTKASGMGIGLAICRSIIEAHGGQLAARSRPGEGSTFFFTLPVAS